MIGLGYLDRLYFIEPEFTLLAPNEKIPALPLTAEKSIGSPEAPITMFIFSDFLCFPCQQFAISTMEEIHNKYVTSGKVRIIFKYYASHGESSMLAAQAAECAAVQNKFWAFHDLLMAKQPVETDVTIACLEGIAREAGLDMMSFSKSLQSGEYRDVIISAEQEAEDLNVTASPSYYVNRMKGRGYQSFQAFEDIFKELLGNDN